jgi:hypothetical protein
MVNNSVSFTSGSGSTATSSSEDDTSASVSTSTTTTASSPTGSALKLNEGLGSPASKKSVTLQDTSDKKKLFRNPKSKSTSALKSGKHNNANPKGGLNSIVKSSDHLLSTNTKSKSTSSLKPGKGLPLRGDSSLPGSKKTLLHVEKLTANVSSSPGKSSPLTKRRGGGGGLGSPGGHDITLDHKLALNSKSKSKSSLSLKKGRSSKFSMEEDSLGSPGSSKKSSFHDDSDLTNNTALFERNLDIYRKFRVAVRETEDCIQSHHDRALKRVQERVMKETLESKIEVESRLLKEESLSIKQSFLLEADVAKEDLEQLRALKLYHQMHIQRLLPLWFKTLNDCTTCIASNGHSDKLQWRSQSRKLLLCALKEMDDDDSSDVVKAKVRYLALSINARKAQQVLGILKHIREEYIRHKEGNSELGHHSSELRRVRGLMNPDKPCVLERAQWSTDLESSVSNVKNRNETSLINQTAHGSTIMSIDDEFTLATTEDSFTMHEDAHLSGMNAPAHGNNIYEFSSMDDGQKREEVSKQLLPNGSQQKKDSFMLSTSSTPVDPHNNIEIMRLLRESSCQGLLQEAWRVFSHFYGEYINNVKDEVFLHMNLKCVPSLDTFKLLIMAFKNSESNQFDDVSTIFILMKRASIEPDLEIFNMILRSCERRGAWRRALKYLKVVQHFVFLVSICFT